MPTGSTLPWRSMARRSSGESVMNCSSAPASLIRWRSCHRQSFQSRSVAAGKKRLRKAERADRFIRWRKVYKDRAYVRSRIVTSSRTSDRDRRSTVGLTILEDAGESEHDDHNRDDDQQFRKTHRRAPWRVTSERSAESRAVSRVRVPEHLAALARERLLASTLTPEPV